jgi:hypothetical protein
MWLPVKVGRAIIVICGYGDLVFDDVQMKVRL